LWNLVEIAIVLPPLYLPQPSRRFALAGKVGEKMDYHFVSAKKKQEKEYKLRWDFFK